MTAAGSGGGQGMTRETWRFLGISLIVLPAVALGGAAALSRIDRGSYPDALAGAGFVLLGIGLVLTVVCLVGGLRTTLAGVDLVAGLPADLRRRATRQLRSGVPPVRDDEVDFLREAARRIEADTWTMRSFASGTLLFAGMVLSRPGERFDLLAAAPLWTGMIFTMSAVQQQRRRKRARRFLAAHPPGAGVRG